MKKILILCLVSVLAILYLTASTSGLISFSLLLIVVFFSKNSFRIKFSVAIFTLLIVLFSLIFIDLESFVQQRISNRILNVDAPLEEHENIYFNDWLTSPLTFFFGFGYSHFSVTSNYGFRLIPNGVSIFYGITGGLILIGIYLMLFVRSLRYWKTMVIFAPCAIIYSTNSNLFLLLIFSTTALKIISQPINKSLKNLYSNYSSLDR